MTSVVFTTVSQTLKDEFCKVQEGLKEVESSIRRLTGRQPDRTVDVRKRGNADQWNDGVKRKRIASFIRQESPSEVAADCEPVKKPALMSTIVTKAPAVKPIKCVTENQERDCQGLARNKRMFGMILGTLQKFQTEESRRSSATQRREEIEKKLEQEAEQEKANVKKERTELFRELRDKQATERKLQQKIERVESHEQKMTPESEKRLKDTKDKYRMIVAEKRAKVQKDLNDIEELYQEEVHTIDDSNAVNQTTVTASQNIDNRLLDVENDSKREAGKVTSHDLENGDANQEGDQNHEAGKVVDEEAAATPPDGTGAKDFEPNYDE